MYSIAPLSLRKVLWLLLDVNQGVGVKRYKGPRIFKPIKGEGSFIFLPAVG